MHPIVITEEKFDVYKSIRKHGLINMSNYSAIIKEAWDVFGTVLFEPDIRYIEKHYQHLEKEFKEEKDE